MKQNKTTHEKKLVLGIDEAGRGCVIGPMIIAAVLGDERKFKLLGVRDSKELTPERRESLAAKIKRSAKEIHVIEISAKTIDEMRKIMSLNELEAMKMAELIELFSEKSEKIVIDCPDTVPKNFLKRLKKYIAINVKIVAEHYADKKHPSVSAASIIAKTERDKRVAEIEKEFKIKVGTGYPHDPATIKFLQSCKEYPDFVRKSWDTSKRISESKGQKKIFEFS